MVCRLFTQYLCILINQLLFLVFAEVTSPWVDFLFSRSNFCSVTCSEGILNVFNYIIVNGWDYSWPFLEYITGTNLESRSSAKAMFRSTARNQHYDLFKSFSRLCIFYTVTVMSNDEELHQELVNAPLFHTPSSPNATVLVGATAYLNCRIHGLNDRTVSWIRHKDIHLLTVNTQTYTSDNRFSTIHNPKTGDWKLQIKSATRSDSGVYECQVSSTPPVGISVSLSVVEPVTYIVGESPIYIKRGSTLNLTCIVIHSPEPPSLIYWTHETKEINYDSPRGGVTVITEKGEQTTSYLLIQRTQIADAGNYTCHPSNANSKTILVNVLREE